MIKQSGSVVYPFDESQPVVKCSPLRACDIELQAGRDGARRRGRRRRALDHESAGERRSRTARRRTSSSSRRSTTSRRIWSSARRGGRTMSASSRSLSRASRPESSPTTGTWPSTTRTSWCSAGRRPSELRAAAASQAREPPAAVEISAVLGRAAQLRLHDQGRTRRSPWTPTTVFDDGQHVYIRLPAVGAVDGPSRGARRGRRAGSWRCSNYRLQGSWYVVDGLFRRAELVVGVGGRSARSRSGTCNRPAAGPERCQTIHLRLAPQDLDLKPRPKVKRLNRLAVLLVAAVGIIVLWVAYFVLSSADADRAAARGRPRHRTSVRILGRSSASSAKRSGEAGCRSSSADRRLQERPRSSRRRRGRRPRPGRIQLRLASASAWSVRMRPR